MNGRLNPGVLGLALSTLLVAPLAPLTHADAQEPGGRVQVLIPAFFPDDGTDDDFGKDVADELRKMMQQLATHTAIEKGDIEDNLRRFDMKMDELDCIKTRQLGGQMNAAIALCAQYEEVGDKQYRLYNIEFWDLQSSQKFDVDGFNGTERDNGDRTAAQQIATAFETFVEQSRYRVFCQDYAQNKQWENALDQCDQALAMNPNDEPVRYQRAIVLYEMEDYEASLAELRTVLEQNPIHDAALQRAGYVAMQLGLSEEGLGYYERYLELNPGNAGIRRRLAYDMYEAGDPAAAMRFIREGLDVESDPELLRDYGNYAFAAAATAATPDTQDATLAPEVAELYREAIDAYTRAFEELGSDMEVGPLRNVVNAYIQLEDFDQALGMAEQILEVHPEEAAVWSAYASALQRSGRTDEALQALQRIESIEPDFPDLYARQGNMLLEAGRLDEALPVLRRAVERGNAPDRVARLLFVDGHQNGVRRERWDYARQRFEAAKTFGVSTAEREQLDFWHGWSLFQIARARQEPQTLASAQASKPLFEQAKRLFEAARPYGQRQSGVDIPTLIDNANTFIEIQDAIIRRGR